MSVRPCKFLETADGWNFGTHQQICTKIDPIIGHETISAASRTLNVLHMILVSDAEKWCWLLEAHGCQAMQIFGNRLAETLALISKSVPKLIPLLAMKPYQLPPDP
jgi:hypothetical protein